MDHLDPLRSAVSAAIRPTRTEVLRAKRAIRELVADCEPHGVRTLQTCLHMAEGIPSEPTRGERLRVGSNDDIDRVVTHHHPLIRHLNLALAASEAIVDLIAQGILVPVAAAPVHHEGQPLVGADEVNVPYQLGGESSGIRLPTFLPEFARAFRLAPHRAEDASAWFFDPDLFTADLESLCLDRRTLRCITEALDSYRDGLFLGCSNLLGAASEGAWYAAGEQLRHLDTALAKALGNKSTTKVISRTAEVLRQHGKQQATIDELTSQAALLRQLRNYGVHPRTDKSDHLDRYFSESGSGLLLLESFTYFKRLANSVTVCLAAEEKAAG